MGYKIILSVAALRELTDSVDWYSEQQHGLGAQFVTAIDKSLDLVSNNPQIFTARASGYHEATVKKFPFLIVYRTIDRENVVRVLHIFHTKRNPELKK